MKRRLRPWHRRWWRLRWRGAAVCSARVALRERRSPFVRCCACGKRTWAEEIIVNFGSCDYCFNKGFEAYMKRQGA